MLRQFTTLTLVPAALACLISCSNGTSQGPLDTGLDSDVQGDLGADVSIPDSTDLGRNDGTDDGLIPDGVPTDSDVPDGTPPKDANDVQAPIVPGALIVTEFMANPDNTGGEYQWIEFYNTTDEWLTLAGCTLRDEGGESTTVGAGALVPPKGFALLTYVGTPSSWLGTDPVGYYSDVILEETGDEILLECRGALIDKVTYGPGVVVKLASTQLKPELFSGSANDDAGAWCTALEPFGDGLGLGTPGLANSACVVVDPCEPNPCQNPPAPGCDSQAAVVLSFTGPGECRLVGQSYACDYPPHVEDCKSNGQICQNAQCITVIDPCNPDPCATPPGDYCQPDFKTLVHYTGAGVCSVVDGVADCQFDSYNEDCSDQGKQCKAAKCVEIIVEAKPTAVGDVIISEFMAQAGPEPDYGEWIELYNTTNTALNMKDCALIDMSGQAHTFFGNVVIEAHGYLLLGRSADTVKNYGITPDYVYSGFLLDNGSDYIIIKCGTKKIDELFYQSAFLVETRSTQLDPPLMNYLDNDLATSWCPSQFPFGTAGRFGTPGTANIACSALVEPVDWCALYAPLEQKAVPGTMVLYAGLVQESPWTDITPFVDPQGPIRADVGYGPIDSDPASEPLWVWQTAFGNPAWNGLSVGLEDADEYTLAAEVPALGFYDVAFRFSADEGATWTYCDTMAGEGMDGSEDGYSSQHAGKLYVMETIDPCVPNPCTLPPAGTCEPDGKWLIYAPSPGVCSSSGPESEAVCDYPTVALNCKVADPNMVCLDGACVLP